LTRRITSIENTHEKLLNTKLENLKLNIQLLAQNTTDINSKLHVLKEKYGKNSYNENRNSTNYLINLIQQDVNLREIRKNVGISINSAHTLSGILNSLKYDIVNISVTLDSVGEGDGGGGGDRKEGGNDSNGVINSPRVFEDTMIKENMLNVCADLNENVIEIFKELNNCDDYFQNHDIHIEGKWILLSDILKTKRLSYNGPPQSNPLPSPSLDKDPTQSDSKTEDLFREKVEDLYREIQSLSDELRLLKKNVIGSVKNDVSELQEQNVCMQDELKDMRGILIFTNSALQNLAEEVNKKGNVYV
jgi:hypothetical protein